MSRLRVSAVSTEDYESSVSHSAQDFTLSDLFAMNKCPTLDFPCESADYYYKIGVLLYQLMYVNQNNEKALIDDLKYGYLPVVVKTPRGKLFKVNKLGCMPNHEHNPCLYADDTVNEKSIIYSDTLVKELLFAFNGFSIRNKKGEPLHYQKDDFVWVMIKGSSKCYLIDCIEIQKIKKDYYDKAKFNHHIVLNLVEHDVNSCIFGM